jgi:signal transduction histidine kinase
LDELGLAPAVRALGERFSASTGIVVEAEVSDRKLPDLVATAAFRVVQEALENVRRHAQARTVRIWIEGEQGPVRGGVADDGIGFNPARVGEGLGLSGMREWVESLGGSLAVRSAPGRGTQVEFTIPCHDPGPDRR